MKRRAGIVLLLALGCELGGDVDHRGRYGFLPGQGPVSTAPLPLGRMLVVESDASVDRTRIYYFEGELGAANVGVDDLRKLALGFNRFDMSFTPPVEHAMPGGEAGAGGAGTPDDTSGAGLELSLDAQTVELRSISSDELAASGAARFASVLEGSGYRIRAYFGVLAVAAPFESVVLGTLAYSRQLSPLELEVVLGESSLAVDYGDPQRLDYLELDLLQSLVRSQDRQLLDAGVVTRVWSGTNYAPSFELLTNVFEQACWSLEAPLMLRATQYSQSYFRAPDGDFAVLERRTDQLELEPEAWTPAIGEARAAEYCSALESDQ